MLHHRHLLAFTATFAWAAAVDAFRFPAFAKAIPPAAAQLDVLMDTFFQESLRPA